MIYALAAMIIAFGISALIAPLVIKLASKFKAKQIILSYVDNHQSKSGTPTMGGIIFIVAIIVASLICFRGDKLLGIISLGVIFAYGINGFLDDFIKIKFKRNEGLSAWQKIVFQFSIAAIIGFFAYFNPVVGSQIFIPFTSYTIDLKWGIIPFNIFVFLAVTNSVNLTDGLDGLASGVTVVYSLAFGAIVFTVIQALKAGGESADVISEYTNLLALCGAIVGALLAFLLFNSYPAKIFMGDTGSLALGGAVGSLAVMTKLSLIVPIIGITFVASSISVILQVLHFKRTKKRIFLMAPLHHHFERKGMSETKIATLYMAVTAIIGGGALLATILFF